MTKQLRPEVGVAIIIIKDNKVLFGKRKNKHGADTWHFPGGHIEMTESFEQTAIRETKEETNVDIKNVRVIGPTNDVFVEEGKHYVTIFTIADYAGGEVKDMEPDKAEGWDWYEWDKLPQPYFLPVENLLKTGFNPFE